MERMAADVSGDSLQRLMTFPCKTVTSIVAHVMAFAFVFSCFLQGFAQGFGGGFWVFLTQAVMFFAFLVVLARMLIFMLPIQFSGKSRKLGLIMDLVAASLVAAVVVLQIIFYFTSSSKDSPSLFGYSLTWVTLITLITGAIVDMCDAKSGDGGNDGGTGDGAVDIGTGAGGAV